MVRSLIPFDNWNDVRNAALAGVRLYYGAPMDAASSVPFRSVLVSKVYKNGNLRIDPLTSGVPNFTADSGHLNRFRRFRRKDQ